MILIFIKRNHIQLIGRIEQLQLFHGNIEQIRDLFERHLLFNHYCVGRKMLYNRLVRPYSVFIMVFENVHGSQKCRNVSLGFFWKIFSDIPIILLSARATNRFGNIAGTRVIGCQYQIPISKNGIHFCHISCRGFT